MDDTNQNHDGEAESISFEPAPMVPEVESDAEPVADPETAIEEITPEETEPEENDDFEIGITIEEMQADKAPARMDRLEPPEGGMDDEAPIETAVQANEALPDTDPVLSAMTAIDERIVRLADLFETKIKVDSHKDKVIDNLHAELQTFREGVIKKQFYSFVTDVIKVIDDVRKFKRHYDEMPPTAENMDSLLNFLEGIASDIEDLFSWQGVVPFCCEEGILDTGRQRVINKIECDDPARDRMVAESLRPGYEWDGRVIRPEMVSVYKYVNTNVQENVQENGQEDTLADGQTD